MIYAYCVIDSAGEIGERIEGLDGGVVYNIPYRGMGLAASEIKEGVRDIDGIQVLRHEEVVERLMAKFTVLPMRFSTVFGCAKDALTMLEKYYDEFKDNLGGVCGKAEYGIRIIWNGEGVKGEITCAVMGEGRRHCASDCSPARRYVGGKLIEHRIERAFEAEAEKRIAFVDGFFTGVASEKKLEKLKRDKLLVNAFYLVQRENQGRFMEAFERLQKESSGLRFLLSGPWPPYNFVRVKILPHSLFHR